MCKGPITFKWQTNLQKKNPSCHFLFAVTEMLMSGLHSKLTALIFPQWDAFSSPELSNFLRILKREEEEHVKQIILRYTRARERLQEAISSSKPG